MVEVARSLANVTHSLNTFQVHAIGIKRLIQYTQKKTTGDSMACICIELYYCLYLRLLWPLTVNGLAIPSSESSDVLMTLKKEQACYQSDDDVTNCGIKAKRPIQTVSYPEEIIFPASQWLQLFETMKSIASYLIFHLDNGTLTSWLYWLLKIRKVAKVYLWQ